MDKQLIAIYNTLCQLEVKGDNVLILADTIRALKAYIQEKQQTETAQPEEKEEPEEK